MNVSFTRARSKLVIFGSRKTLQGDKLLGDFFDLMDEQGWIFQLPADATQLHVFGVDMPVASGQSGKRGILDSSPVDGDAAENGLGGSERPKKKVKKADDHYGILRGRPILKDLFNETK